MTSGAKEERKTRTLTLTACSTCRTPSESVAEAVGEYVAVDVSDCVAEEDGRSSNGAAVEDADADAVAVAGRLTVPVAAFEGDVGAEADAGALDDATAVVAALADDEAVAALDAEAVVVAVAVAR